MKYSKEELLAMYRSMVLGRVYEDELWLENQKGRLYSMIHLSTGQEAIGTAVAFALKDDEPFMPSHRCRPLHLHRLDVYGYLAEEVGLKTGYCHGISGDPQIIVHEKGFLGNPGPLGQGCPMATGYAFALKYLKTGKAMVQNMGDGTFNQGAVYEALNWAVVQKLPIVYVVENNAFAMSTLQTQYVGTEALAERAQGVGMRAVTIDGNDVLAMREAMDVALERARKESLPTLVEAVTYRVMGHYAGDTAPYRDKEYHEEMQRRHPDPIPRYEKVLLESGTATQADFDAIKAEITKLVRDAMDRVISEVSDPANKPTPADVIRPELIYATPMEGLL